ncbi:cationic amino acid transporter [Natronococcus jeotgali DSM 18795]|uniref:Cationic amino acid transporter n=2 Tax=Natronococcus jeotgali TaxID=413812 RepID=L9XIV5_9EURY|nr:cationic amino acid transporter [Natronococcus jeotgali DSM 18795]
MLNWIVNAGGLGIVVAWLLVAVSFLILRYSEPEMDRPYKAPAGWAVGLLGLALTAFFVYLYLPGGQSALLWPYEWAIVLLWCLLGIILYSVSEGYSEEHATMAAKKVEQLKDD